MTNFSINGISENTGLDRRTIKRKLAKAGLLTGRDSWTLPEVLPILFADAELTDHAANRNRLVLAQARKVEIENHQSLSEWLPAALVERVLTRLLSELRMKILASSLTPREKQDLLKDLMAVPLDDMMQASVAEVEAEENENAKATNGELAAES